uniref:40S ribosomal protein S24 n=1 Tax=Trieres chinensis TaxID=1514140 RepID=A0A7S1YXX4_TRICV|mmetsp:Transcript_13375/g.27620  ORF Transcript_13375/g.27620 Transcript_13375/m.27620 type:complete len:138 (+) Transcript_13375:152-565(+)|eukprot:CAMPEP_0183293100 /NCGR_PEP_ID=MMETSP0160_2-20130417/1913_1 /TAXON_ID=2839 ORGANISM="Odontella Sinensis, Strain Grunow 1884" /NCGR_SAMPLE_ID=MMETSP0160_2 /ASSEMBLY_ACC=CAM_ASM_000250 /LENGTH=137 /DNA_ID=CAMNT_0025454161 /DNA_START=152 /DNA_END=565 /DNA_ORIENTATION=-
MSDSAVIVKTRKFKRNPLLSRRQMIVDIIHPGRANVPRAELQEVVGGMHKADPKLTIVFGFRTKFGGGKSTGFCLIYDNEDALRKFEPKYRLIRSGFQEAKEQSRKAIKEAKNKGLKIRGTGRSIAKHKAKRAAGAD